MGQRGNPGWRGRAWPVLALLAVVGLGGCDRDNSGSLASPSTQKASAKSPRIASFVPSATDLLISGGMGDYLVAVSSYDRANPAVAGRQGSNGGTGWPSAGDYETTDWERLTLVKPEVLLTFIAKDRLPAGMVDRADKLGTRIVNLKIETVGDVLSTWTFLGELTGETDKARNARQKMEAGLAEVKAKYASAPRVRVVMVMGEPPFTVIGPDTFLDELLTMAGGENVANALGKRYPTVDLEKLAALRPEVVLHLLPSASEQRVAQAKVFWANHPELPGSDRAQIMTHWSLLQPGAQLVETAQTIGELIHGGKGAK